MPAYIAGLGLGALSFSPLLFWHRWRRRRIVGRARRRGGYLARPASPFTNQGTILTTAGIHTTVVYSSFNRPPGDTSAGAAILRTPPDPSKPGGPGFSGAMQADDSDATGYTRRRYVD